MSTAKKIIFTGGSTGGHIAPNIPLIEACAAAGWETHCVILGTDMERTLLTPTGVTLHTIAVGKLRRYFDWQNITDMFRTVRGFVEAVRIVRAVRPDVIFSKGGNIAVPMAFAAWLYRVPFFVHESDMLPSLTTRITAPVAHTVFSGFPVDSRHVWRSIIGTRIQPQCVGIPLRAAFRNLPAVSPRHDRDIVLVTGGSLGATPINAAVRSALPLLTQDHDIIHMCGKGKKDLSIPDTAAYQQYEFVDGDRMCDLMQRASIVITRGSATTLSELLALRKRMLIIPLSRKVSRGDQIANAAFIESHHLGAVLSEDALSPQALYDAVMALKTHREAYEKALAAYTLPDSVGSIMQELTAVVRG